MKKIILFTLCTMLIASLIFSLGACSGKNSENSKNNEPNGTETLPDGESEGENPSEKKETTANPDLIEEGQYLFFKENPIITDKGDYYEIEDVCLASGGEFYFDLSMFEGKKAGDTIRLPNGEFTVEEIMDLEDCTQFVLTNGYFEHYFLLYEDGVQAVGIGEYLVLETKYSGALRFAKNCRYEIQEDFETEPVQTNFREHIEDREYPWEYGSFLYINELDSKNNITAVSDVLLP